MAASNGIHLAQPSCHVGFKTEVESVGFRVLGILGLGSGDISESAQAWFVLYEVCKELHGFWVLGWSSNS